MDHFYHALGVFKPEFKTSTSLKALDDMVNIGSLYLSLASRSHLGQYICVPFIFPPYWDFPLRFSLFLYVTGFFSSMFSESLFPCFFSMPFLDAFTFVSCLSDPHIASIGLCYHKSYKQLRVHFADYTFNKNSKPEMGGWNFLIHGVLDNI